MSKTFKVQIATDIVRDSSISAMEFVVYAKLIHLYYLSDRKEELEIPHAKLMYYLNIKENRTFRSCINNLTEKGYLLSKVDKLPRHGALKIKINIEKIPTKENGIMFAQVTSSLLDKYSLDKIDYVGCRLIYYYQSYINSKTGKEYAYPSEETIAEDLGITEKTVRKYNKKLESVKFAKIIKHELSTNNEYIRKADMELLYFTKYNNHYYVREDMIDKYIDKLYKKVENE